MRSRYSAFVKHAFAHLHASLSAEQQKDYSREEAERWAKNSEWLGLQIVKTDKGGPDDTSGLVEFMARFKAQDQEHEHHEIAVFGRENGQWVYTGQVGAQGTPVRREGPKIGRNDPCPCGSGKKYKKCCAVG